VTPEFALEWMRGQNWDWHESGGDMSDAESLVAHIMASRVRFDHEGMSRESAIGELVKRACYPGSNGYDDAIRGLGGYGIKVKDDRLIISNSAPQLRAILDKTPWGVWKRTLGDYPGADNCENKSIYFGPGVNTKATSIPIAAAIGSDIPDEVEIDWN
jgi:hypothetical protein